MAIRLKVRRKKQIVVPIRFTRAVTGDPDPAAPDVDDRGFVMGTRPGTWGSTAMRGAMVSVQEGDTIKVKVLREDIDATAPLFVVSTNSDMASISGAAGPLGADGIFSLEGVKDSKNVPVKIEVHLGADDGPVLGELEPHIFQQRQLRVRAHLVSINPPASGPDADSTTTQTAAGLVALFVGVNKIWRAAGVEFLYNEDETRSMSISGFAVKGQVTTHLDAKPPTFAEFSRLLNFHDPVGGDRPDPNAINVYFVHLANEWLGLTFDHDEARPSGFGVAIADHTTGRTLASGPHELAHELGHYLDTDVHAGENSERTHVREDLVSERRMMFDAAKVDLANPPYRQDVGYTQGRAGNLITVKELAADPSDGEVARNRFRALNPN